MLNIEDSLIIIPGRIVSYDWETQSAEVEISAERVFSSKSGMHLDKWVTLENVPVHFPSGGGYMMTFPVDKGDSCLLHFSQVGVDHWLYEDKDKGGKFYGRPAPHRAGWSRRRA